MAIASLPILQTALMNNGPQAIPYRKCANNVATDDKFHSLWTDTGTAGTVENPAGASAPTTAAVPTNSTAGGLAQTNGGAGALRILGAQSSTGNKSNNSAPFCDAFATFLYDRLSHQGGLSGTALGAQTTNLPTAALTRYTSGVGVVAMLEVYTTIGSTPQTCTVSYTNQAGTSGQTSPPFIFAGGANARQPSTCAFIPLAVGDTGFRSVESVTLAASTDTVGNFGVTLLKPLAMIPANPNASGGQSISWLLDGGMFGALTEVLDNACLALIRMAHQSSVMNVASVLYLGED